MPKTEIFKSGTSTPDSPESLAKASISAAVEHHSQKSFHDQPPTGESLGEQSSPLNQTPVSREGLRSFFLERLQNNSTYRGYSTVELTRAAKLQALVAKDYLTSISELDDSNLDPELSRRLELIETRILGEILQTDDEAEIEF